MRCVSDYFLGKELKSMCTKISGDDFMIRKKIVDFFFSEKKITENFWEEQ
jgi:hypothetical protein